jgi:hypothetical protein
LEEAKGIVARTGPAGGVKRTVVKLIQVVIRGQR